MQAHTRVNEINKKCKNIISSLTTEQKKKYDKRSEKKVNKARLEHHNKLQAQLNELTAKMPEQQKWQLQQSI